jgi:dTDP-4-amino-4,6-dideoxygalactose transaminase
MAAMLIRFEPGDEVIIPSFTFVSTANAFIIGATVVFTDSGKLLPNNKVSTLETLINERTRAIVMVPNAGIACDMDTVMYLAQKYGLYVVEDSAHSIDSWYQERYLGGIGHLDTFSFHETENINSGAGYRFKFR